MQMDRNFDSIARKRLSYLFDEGNFTEIGSLSAEKENPASVITAYGYVGGALVYAFSQDKEISLGAVGPVHAQKIAKLYSLAAKTGRPVVGIHDSNGAFVDGTIDSLTAYSDMIGAASAVSGVVPQISVISGVCAGSAALFACSADFVVMTRDAELFVSPSSLYEKNGAGCEAAAEAGNASLICDDDEKAMDAVKELLRLIPENNLTPVPVYEYSENAFQASKKLDSMISNIADEDSVTELSKDFGKASYTALATIGGSTAGIVATNKTDDKLTSDDCSKISRFIRTCDAFGIPVVTILDTEGFAGDNSVRNMTMLAGSYAEATTGKITLVSGKAYGPVFAAFAGKGSDADFVFAYEDAVISAMEPQAAVEFLWHEKLSGAADVASKRKELAAEYISAYATAVKAAERNGLDEIISAEETRNRIIGVLDILSGKRVSNPPRKHSNLPL